MFYSLAQNGGVWEYLLPDALGSVRQIVDANGNVTLAKSYEPYGTVLTSTGTASSIFAYAGEQIDTTGLIYLRARYMNPRLGIFLARDPWSGDVLRPGSMNGFGYVEGNPINRVDPSGRDPYSELLLPNPSTSPDRTDDQTVLNSTIRFAVGVTNDPCDQLIPIKLPPWNRDIEEATGTYMGNNHIYTHRHGSFRYLGFYGKGIGISKVQKWDGQYIYGGKNSPVDHLSIIPVIGSQVSGENTDIVLSDYLDKMFKMNGIPPAQRGDPNELTPVFSIVSVPIWNEGAERYEVFHAHWLLDTTKKQGVPSGLFGRIDPRYTGPEVIDDSWLSAYRDSKATIQHGDSGGGLWHHNKVLGNTWMVPVFSGFDGKTGWVLDSGIAALMPPEWNFTKSSK